MSIKKNIKKEIELTAAKDEAKVIFGTEIDNPSILQGLIWENQKRFLNDIY